MDDRDKLIEQLLSRVQELEERQERTEQQMQTVFSHIGELYNSQSMEQTAVILGNLGKSTFEAEKSTFYCVESIEDKVFTVNNGERIHTDIPNDIKVVIESGEPVILNRPQYKTAYIPVKDNSNTVMGVVVAENGNFNKALIDKFNSDGEIGSVFRLGLEKERHYQTATTDKLTKLKNRHGMEHYAENNILKSLNTDKPVSVIMCDIDKFKSVNDTYGHAAGDTVLSKVAEIIKSSIRAEDGAFRFGGEEFMIAVSGLEKIQAYDIADRIRETLANIPIDIGNGKEITVTISMGIEQISADKVNKDNIHQIIAEAQNKADEMLYKAKNTGRNKVVMAEPEDFLFGYDAEKEINSALIPVSKEKAIDMWDKDLDVYINGIRVENRFEIENTAPDSNICLSEFQQNALIEFDELTSELPGRVYPCDINPQLEASVPSKEAEKLVEGCKETIKTMENEKDSNHRT